MSIRRHPTVSIQLGLSTVEAYLFEAADNRLLATITIRAAEDQDNRVDTGTALWDGSTLNSPDLQLCLDPGINADAWDRLSIELAKAEAGRSA